MLIKLSSADYPQVIECWEQSVLATHNFFTPKEVAYYKPLVFKYGLPQCSEIWGFKENNQVIGFMGIRDNKIEMLFFSPFHLRQGLGTKLVNFAIHQRHCRFVDVNEENQAAYKFYQHLGFQVFSRDETDDCGKPHPILHLQINADNS